jgi:ABC-type tungstate transport system substrate-binding protein
MIDSYKHLQLSLPQRSVYMSISHETLSGSYQALLRQAKIILGTNTLSLVLIIGFSFITALIQVYTNTHNQFNLMVYITDIYTKAIMVAFS